MSNLLIQHAIENVWCEPRQDKQHTIGLARLSPLDGVSHSILIQRVQVLLPPAVAGSFYFHVYQLGRLPLEILNLAIDGEWKLLLNVAEATDTVIDLFTARGLHLPLSHTFIKKMANGNVILAVSLKWFRPYERERVYIRLYTNSLFETFAWRAGLNIPSANIRYLEHMVVNIASFLEFRNSVAQIKAAYGVHGAFITMVDGIEMVLPTTYSESLNGRMLSFLWDVSIYKKITIPFSDMLVFDSLRDSGLKKYAFIPDYDGAMTIDFHDDADFYVSNGVKSYYVGRLKDYAVRQLTHKAYSLDKKVFDAVGILNNIDDDAGVSAVMYMRKTGNVRTLKSDNLHLEHLYTLPVNVIKQSLTDVVYNDTIPEWHVANLENAALMTLMSSDLENITSELVEAAYGYNDVSKLVLPTAHKTLPTGSDAYVVIPESFNILDKVTGLPRRTIFAYSDGSYLGWLNSNTSNEHLGLTSGLSTTDTVEIFNANTRNMDSGNVYGTTVYESWELAQYGFRCYVTPSVGGIPLNQWTDVTDTDYYVYDPIGMNGVPTITWNTAVLANGSMHPCIRVGGVISLCIPDLDVSVDGTLEIAITENVLGVPKALTLCPGVIDIFMDRKSLMRNVDYYVKWPKIVICRRPDITDNLADIVVRYYGWKRPDSTQPDLYRERGYVKEGILSVNCQYDIREDRNNRIVVGGLLAHPSDVKFSETDATGFLATDGRPFTVSDYAVAIENISSKRTIPWRAEDVSLDERVMTYLTKILGVVAPLRPTIAGSKWHLFSPFISTVLSSLVYGTPLDVDITNGFTDGTIDALTDGWFGDKYYLLDFDPFLINTQHQYVQVFPHPYRHTLGLTNVQYRYVEYINARFFNSGIDLSPSLTIG